MTENRGILYVIATPIGNIEDVTYRAIRILKENVDIACCEDTRQSRKLLNNYNISLPTTSIHSHTSEKKLEYIIRMLIEGKSEAYMTDSGIPGVSDLGSRLVNLARKNEIQISPIPGPSALASIVSVSGFPEKRVIFSGFLSKKPGRRKRELRELKIFKGIIVIYESPYRIKKLIADINEIFSDREVIIGREMTKIYEEFIHDKATELHEDIDSLTEKGEFTVAIYNHTVKDV